jgi:phage FluMu protein Com
MSIEFRCNNCGKLLLTPADSAGRTAQCPECGALTQVPVSNGGNTSSTSPAAKLNADDSATDKSPPVALDNQNNHASDRQSAYLQNQRYAMQRISAPAISLMVTAILGILSCFLQLSTILLHLQPLFDPWKPRQLDFALTGPISIVQSVIAILVCVFIFYGAAKMKNLENYGLALTVSIISMIPCFNPCCCLGLPFGIWAIVILSNPAVKNSFRG